MEAPHEIAGVVELARRFSLHVEGMPLLYNLLLARRRQTEHGDGEERIHEYLGEIEHWAIEEQQEHPFNPDALWVFMAKQGVRMVEPQRRFVESWTVRLNEIGAHAITDDVFLAGLIEQREIQLKGQRARLRNPGRLLDWTGRAGVGRLNFRWFVVKRYLADLHAGLAG